MIKGIITDIQRASFHDGEGIRTTVFLKGCPLSCRWCHNPECISFEPECMEYPEKCIGCGMCHQGCYAGAKVVCGKKMTAAEVLEEVALDIPYYIGGGGVTISGGEPMAQKQFVKELISLCKEYQVGCAMETSLIYYDEDIFIQLDFIMADLKVWDSDTHKQYTGVGNDVIKENFKKLNSLGIPIIARTPIIPEINQGIDQISNFMRSLDHVVQYELLPYHPLGISKQKALGKEPVEFTVPSKEYMEEVERYAYIR